MLKILVVEDAVTSRKVLAGLIYSLGYVPVLASDGARGLAVLEDNPDIACVVTDCQMPHVDGPEMLKEIRRQLGPKMPVLIYSSFLPVRDVGNLIDSGATSFLNFPVTRDNLKEYLGRYLPHG